MFKGLLTALVLFVGMHAQAAEPAYEGTTVSTATGKATKRLNGVFHIGRSSPTWSAPQSTPTITLDGGSGSVRASSATLTYSVVAATAVFTQTGSAITTPALTAGGAGASSIVLKGGNNFGWQTDASGNSWMENLSFPYPASGFFLQQQGGMAIAGGLTAISSATVLMNDSGPKFIHRYDASHSAGIGVYAGGSEWSSGIWNDGGLKASFQLNGGTGLGTYAAAANAPSNGLAVSGDWWLGSGVYKSTYTAATGALALAGGLNVKGTITADFNGNNQIVVGVNASGGSTSRVTFLPSSSQINWDISANRHVLGALEFVPSTTGGGTTFSTPAMVLTSDGKLGINTTAPEDLLSVGYTAIPNNDGIMSVAGTLISTGIVRACETNGGDCLSIYHDGTDGRIESAFNGTGGATGIKMRTYTGTAWNDALTLSGSDGTATFNGSTMTVSATGGITAPSQPGVSARQVTSQALSNGNYDQQYFGDAACAAGCYSRGGVWGGSASSGTFTTNGAGLYFLACKFVFSGQGATTLLSVRIADDAAGTNIFAFKQWNAGTTNTLVDGIDGSFVYLPNAQALVCSIRADTAGVTANGSLSARMTVQKVW